MLDEIKDVHEEFLQHFMDAERRAIDLGDQLAGRDVSRAVNLEELRVLIIDEVDDLVEAMAARRTPTTSRSSHANSAAKASIA